MHRFEIDLPEVDAERFDRAFWRFVSAELFERPDVQTQMDSQPLAEGRTRRAVSISCAHQLEAFARHWQLCGANA